MRWVMLGLMAAMIGGGAAMAAPPTPLLPQTEPAAQPVAATRSEVVRQVQASLAAQGYYTGVVDGINGPKTRAAVRSYETAHGLPVTGDPYILAESFRSAAISAASPPPVVVAPIRPAPVVVRPWPRPRYIVPGRPVVRFFGPRRWR